MYFKDKEKAFLSFRHKKAASRGSSFGVKNIDV